MSEEPGVPSGPLVVTCTCGWNTTGTEEEVVPATQEHAQNVHWTEIEPEDVLEMAQPAG